jgi:MFS family permease
MYVPLTIYIQSVLGLSPLRSGLTTVAVSVGSGAAGMFAGHLSDRISGKYVVMTGFAVFATGLGLIGALARTDTNPWTLRCALLVCGLGGGSIFSPLVNVATSTVPLQLMGAASGVYNTARQIGAVVGSASVGVLLQARLAIAMRSAAVARSAALPPAFRGRFIAQLDHAAGSPTAASARTGSAVRPAGMASSVATHLATLANQAFHDAFTAAFRVALLLPAAVLAAGFLLCLPMSRRSRRPAPVQAAATPQPNDRTAAARPCPVPAASTAAPNDPAAAARPAPAP